LSEADEEMTNDAQKLVDSTMHLTLRPQQGDRAKVIATILQWVLDNCSTSLPASPDMDEYYLRMYGTDRVVEEDELIRLINQLKELE
jgi:hypothetical protein